MSGRAETLIPFLSAIVALLGYMAWLLRKALRVTRWVSRLPREHEWLMEQVKTHTRQIDELLKIVAVRVGKEHE